MRIRIGLLGVACLAATAAPALAQGAPETRIGFRAFAAVDVQQFAAKDTFDAVFGKTSTVAPGGGVEVHRLWKQLFARVAFSRAKLDGTSVFVFDGEVFPLDEALELTLLQTEISAGWRFVLPNQPRVVPYAGAGALFVKYDESSESDEPGEAISESFTGSVFFAGVDIAVWRMISAGAEYEYRHVPDALGGGGASEAFGEDNLGGSTFRVLFGIRY